VRLPFDTAAVSASEDLLTPQRRWTTGLRPPTGLPARHQARGRQGSPGLRSAPCPRSASKPAPVPRGELGSTRLVLRRPDRRVPL